MKNNSPEITVLMGVYNDIEFIEEAVESILNQTLAEFEFLIFDDCSTDGSSEILKKYAQNDKRIRLVVNDQNKGLGYNLAIGLEIAKGKYIARMDADDISLKDRLERQYNFFKTNDDYDILGSHAIQIDHKGNEFGIRNVPLENEDIIKYICLCPLMHSSLMYKKEKIINAGNYRKDLKRKQDYELWLRCVDNNLKFKNFKEPVVKYRYTENYYTKYNFKNQFPLVKIGIPWCIKRRSGPMDYLRILTKLVKTFGTNSFREKHRDFYLNFDKRFF